MQQSLLARLTIYQRERFPLVKTATLLACFSAAGVSVSAHLAGRPLPGPLPFAVAFIVSLILFFQMRASDEWKDLEDDRRYRPERPIPRGLVSLATILKLALALVPVALAAALALDARLAALLALAWAWLALMSVEFFCPRWLKSQPVAYLASHMLILPVIDFFVTACEWLPRGGVPPDGLWIFLALSFVNGCALEIGRKIWAPENERPGVETYSALWGPRPASVVWSASITAACFLLCAVGSRTNALASVAAPGFAGLAGCLLVARQFRQHMSPAHQNRIETAAGLWVAACYIGAGLGPVVTVALT